MARQDNIQKAREWTQRLKRFQSSGMTVAKFCEIERVAPHIYYYWVRRFRAAGSKSVKSNGERQAHAVRERNDSTVAPGTGTSNVQLRLASGIQISIPTDNIDALRCIVRCLSETGVGSESGSFQRVVIS